MDENDPRHDRRQVLKYVMIGGVATALVFPSRWLKPVIDVAVVPAHAAASAPATTSTTTTSTTTTTTTTTSTTPPPP